MSEYATPQEPRHAATPPDSSASASAKAPWHPPALEEVDYSATEATPGSVVYDFALMAGGST